VALCSAGHPIKLLQALQIAACHSFLPPVYAGADEDTRRAMNKSFQESNGTALSTSWKDVRVKNRKSADRLRAPVRSTCFLLHLLPSQLGLPADI